MEAARPKPKGKGKRKAAKSGRDGTYLCAHVPARAARFSGSGAARA